MPDAKTSSTPLFELYQLDGDLTRAEVIDRLTATPASLRAIAGAGAIDLTRRAADGEWSAIELLKHVRDVVQVYGMRFKWMILDDDPFLPNYDEDRRVAAHPDSLAETHAILDEINACRAETMRLLRALPPAGWSRRGRREVLGIVELEPYVRHHLAHELQHIEQLRRALGD